MKVFLTLISLLLVTAASAQTHKLLPIDQAGWQMVNYDPHTINTSDTGRVYYKVTLTRQGTVKRLTLLNNTFTASTEKKWRDHLSGVQFERSNSSKPRRKDYTGTISISRERCNPDLQ